jgi:hypothetical protein
MSQLTSTVFGSWGLMVGWNIAPPPPGPMIWKLPGRGALPLIANTIARVSQNKDLTIDCFPLLSLSFLRFLFGRNGFVCQCSCPVVVADPIRVTHIGASPAAPPKAVAAGSVMRTLLCSVALFAISREKHRKPGPRPLSGSSSWCKPISRRSTPTRYCWRARTRGSILHATR